MPNAPDVLRPRAEELVAWLEDEIDLCNYGTDMEAHELGIKADRMRLCLELLRERDVLAKVLLTRTARDMLDGSPSTENWYRDAFAEEARAALRDLHAKGDKT